jgi:membrane-bound serine protease (ClpP class)
LKARRGVTGAFVLALFALTLLMPCKTCAANPRVYVIPLRGQIEHGLASFMSRGLREAAEARADAVIIDIDTPGGYVDAALKMRDAIISSEVRTIAYVNSRAWSAGALIAIACDDIGMKIGSSMGAAETRPKEEKYISAVRAEFEATAELRNRDPIVAGAMVDADVEIPGLIERGKILTLTATMAEDLGFVEYKIRNMDELLEQSDLTGALLVEVKQTSAEWFARLLTNQLAAEILLTLGLIGLAIELFTPGFGIPGTVGIVSLGLFFGGRIMAGLAGWEVVVLFLVGLILLLLEVFVIPGFGVAGILGIVSLIASFVLSYPTPGEGAAALAIAIGIAIVIVALMVFLLSRGGRKGRAPAKLILDHTEAPEEGYVAVKTYESLANAEGVVLTPLKPVGVVDFDGRRVEAISEGLFVMRGARVRVIHIEGNKVFVRPITDTGQED